MHFKVQTECQAAMAAISDYSGGSEGGGGGDGKTRS